MNLLIDKIIYHYLNNIKSDIKSNKSNSDDDSDSDDCEPYISYNKGKSCALMIHKKKNLQRVLYINDGSDKYIDKNIKEFKRKEINDKHFEYHHIPNVDAKRDCVYVCAPNQSGKTTYIARYIKYYKKIYPNRKILLLSKLKDDEIIDKYNPIRINLDDEFVDNPIEPEQLNNCMVIFDDIDTIRNIKVRKEIYKLIDDILCEGAHYNTHIIITNHLMSNYKETRIILNECDSITIFMKAGSIHHIKYVLKTYYGLSNEQINKIMKLKGRCATIFKKYPRVVLHERGVYML